LTQKKVLQSGLRRAGLNTTSALYLSEARELMNLGFADIIQRKPQGWNWARKDSTITTVASTRTYSLASDVGVIAEDSVRNTTDDYSLLFRDFSHTDFRDPDEDETGSPQNMVLRGLNSSTGYWEIDLIPTPDAVKTIAYRYFKIIPDRTSGDDDTDLATVVPLWIQRSMRWFISGTIKGDRGDLEGERQDLALYEAMIDKNMEQDTAFDDVIPRRLQRSDFSNRIEFNVTTGSLG